jgi:hypothetical protein
VAKARVNLKGLKKNVDRLTRDLKNLQKRPATPAGKTEAAALHRKLTEVKSLLQSCPDTMFQMFEVVQPTAKKRARKTAAKRTRKGR